ncbi:MULTISPECIES: hypothetical protein [unclassified Flavobacterium]|uniref:hypothetical protein n=1 Tax=unclassified Flavobacterium TaxID=196869 RepID=UPI00131E9F84|nr:MULTISPECIES: hypothetical protein [unclassified Flavobacterium]
MKKNILKLPIYFVLFALIMISCKDVSKVKIENFDAKKEKIIIDKLIDNEKLQVFHYVKLINEKELQVFNSTFQYDYDMESDGSIEQEYFIYCKDKNIKCIQVFYSGSDISNSKKYYFKKDKRFAIENFENNLSDPSHFKTTYIVLSDNNFNKISESFETKDENGKITSNEKYELPNLKYYKDIDEIISDLGLQELKKSIIQKSSKNLNAKKEDNSISNSSEDKNIDSKHIIYLKKYEDPNTSGTHEIEFKKIEKNVFWVTHYEGAGTRQEYYWKNVNNSLVPCFIFEYGGMDWKASLEYYLEDIKTGKKEEGNATEATIVKLKENFIKENFKSI